MESLKFSCVKGVGFDCCRRRWVCSNAAVIWSAERLGFDVILTPATAAFGLSFPADSLALHGCVAG